jgi:hypothetical protein
VLALVSRYNKDGQGIERSHRERARGCLQSVAAPFVKLELSMTNEVKNTPSPDPIVALLERRSHSHARQLFDDLTFQPELWAESVDEVFWLVDRERNASIQNITQWLRKKRRFEINDGGVALLVRLIILRYEKQLNHGKFELRTSVADQILGTTLVETDNGMKLVAGEDLARELAALPPAGKPRKVNRRSTRRIKVTPEEAGAIAPFVHSLIQGSPHPRSSRLRQWVRHAEDQPEILAIVLRDLKRRMSKPLKRFSISGALAHARTQAMKNKKRFTLNSHVRCLYGMAAIRRFPVFNGWTQFVEHHQGKRQNRALVLLDCFLEDRATGGRPFPRLFWHRDEPTREGTR